MDMLLIPQLDEVDASGEGGANARYRLLKRTPEGGTVILADRAVTRIELAGEDPVRIVMPPEVKGQVRDFFVRVVVTSEEVPEITFAAPAGETVSFEDADEDALKCDIGANVFAFTETDAGIFMVNRKQTDIDVEVVFDPHGGELANAKVAYKLGAQYSSFPTPVLENMVFQGWFTEQEGGIRVKETDRCKTGVVKLHAQWAEYVDPFADAICPAKNLVFHTSGGAEWRVDADVFHSEGGSARSGGIGDSQSTSLTTQVTGAGTLSFFWKAASEDYYDKLQLYVDGNCLADDLSGDSGWVERSCAIEGEGTHLVEWRYVKDGSVSRWQDCGWVDDVVWTPKGGE